MNGPTFAQPVANPKPATPRPNPARTAPKPDADAGGMKLFAYLRLHWLMILFCGTLIGGGGAYAAWELLASKFESYGLLKVSQVPDSIGSSGPNQPRTDFSTYMKTTAGLIKYEFVLNSALRDLRDVPTITAEKDPIKFLEENLIVSASDGSEVIKVTMKGHNPTDVRRIVDAVQAAFMKEVVEDDRKRKHEFLLEVEKAEGNMQKILEGMSPTKGGKFGVQQTGSVTGPPTTTTGTAPGAAPGVLPPLGGVTPLKDADPKAPLGPIVGQPVETPSERLLKFDPKILVNRMVNLEARAEALPGQIRDVQRRIQELDKERKALEKAPIDPDTIAKVESDPEVVTAKKVADSYERDYKHYLGNTENPQAPGIIAKKEKWQNEVKKYDELRQKKALLIEGGKRKAEMEKLKAAADVAFHQLASLKDQEQTVKESWAKAEAMLMKTPLPEQIDRAGFFRRDENGKEIAVYDPAKTNLFAADGVYSRLINMYWLTKLELQSPPRVRVIQQASNPTQKDMRKQIIGTVFAGLLGYGILAMGVIGYETMARRVSSLSDVKTSGPATVVGVIPHTPAQAFGRDPAKRAAANEAIDKLRAYVAQSWLSRGASTVAVTSPIGDEGKAFTAFGLASSLAQAGYKTLLVDFDLRDPALHTFAGVPNISGVCELLRGEGEIASSVQFLPSGLHLVPAGKWSDEARKAATGERLESLLTRLKEPYDCVVVNGHAILTAAESVEVARRCEVVLVCAKYRETTTPLLKRATERVATLEIPYSGVVYVGATEQESLC